LARRVLLAMLEERAIRQPTSLNTSR
jgi:hypothetical protein